MGDKVVWDTTKENFGDVPVSVKIYKALHTAHEPAFHKARDDPRSLTDQQRMEVFMESWIESGVGRAWQAIDGAERVLTHESVERLFRALVAPFGEEHPFSCIPLSLVKEAKYGLRPSQDWPLIVDVANRVLASWGAPREASVKRRRIETIGSGADMRPKPT